MLMADYHPPRAISALLRGSQGTQNLSKHMFHHTSVIGLLSIALPLADEGPHTRLKSRRSRVARGVCALTVVKSANGVVRVSSHIIPARRAAALCETLRLHVVQDPFVVGHLGEGQARRGLLDEELGDQIASLKGRGRRAEHTRGGWGKRQRWGGADGTAGLAAHIGRDVRRELEVDL